MTDEMMAQRITQLTGRRVARLEPCTGGYTNAARRVIRFEDGSTAFAKGATDDQTAGWLQDEIRFYTSVRAPFLADVIAVEVTDRPLLILEDLSQAAWPPPWSAERVDAVLATIDLMHSTRTDQPSYAKVVGDSGWHEVADAPTALLSLGLVSEGWLTRCLPDLLAAQDSVVVDGADLCHFDVRSDNLCLLDDRVALIDWNNACCGNGDLDTAYWLPSLRLEGGPQPSEILPQGAHCGALVTGYFASRAGRPEVPHGPGIRTLQRQQLEIGLDWILPELGLPPVDGQRITSP